MSYGLRGYGWVRQRFLGDLGLTGSVVTLFVTIDNCLDAYPFARVEIIAGLVLGVVVVVKLAIA